METSRLRLLLLISSSFFLGDLLGYFVGQLTYNATMENQDALNEYLFTYHSYLYLVVASFIIPIMEEIILGTLGQGALWKIL